MWVDVGQALVVRASVLGVALVLRVRLQRRQGTIVALGASLAGQVWQDVILSQHVDDVLGGARKDVLQASLPCNLGTPALLGDAGRLVTHVFHRLPFHVLFGGGLLL